jgi:hypothetical protein
VSHVYKKQLFAASCAKRVFDSVVMVAFQITFRAEIHANDIFLFFKKLFLTSAHQNDPKNTNRTQF